MESVEGVNGKMFQTQQSPNTIIKTSLQHALYTNFFNGVLYIHTYTHARVEWTLM